MLLDRARAQLLVVDVQDRLLPAMHEGEAMVERCALLMQAAHRLGIPLTISEQYRRGLGATVARLDNLKGGAAVMEKAHFSCAADPAIAAHIEGLARSGRSQVMICGIEAHVCVTQSALGFKERGLPVTVITDAVTSRRPESVAVASSRLAAAGVTLANTEMAVFEWLHQAGTPEFKDLAKIIK